MILFLFHPLRIQFNCADEIRQNTCCARCMSWLETVQQHLRSCVLNVLSQDTHTRENRAHRIALKSERTSKLSSFIDDSCLSWNYFYL